MADSGVSWRDLEFEYGFRRVSSKSGKTALRWVALGMPRITRQVEQCVFFLYGQNTKTGEVIGPGGTGFLIARQSPKLLGTFHIYAVSNRHVVTDYPDIKLNKGDEGTQNIEFGPEEWLFSDTSDIAVIDVTDHLEIHKNQYPYYPDFTYIDEEKFVTPYFNFLYNVGIGDQTLMVGLFADHAGTDDRLFPVGRFGSLAAMPDEKTRSGCRVLIISDVRLT